MEKISTQLVVAGGGPAGICAALSAARLGLSVALVGNRPVLGGNSSSEIRVWTRGATGGGNLFAEEMGIWGMLRLENFYRNSDGNPVFWDDVLLDAVLREKNIRLFLNTELSELEKKDGRVIAVMGYQSGSERHFRFEADYFIDATGDASLGVKAGNSFDFGEKDLKTGKTSLLGSSILFYTRKEEHPVKFIAPDYAYDMDKIEEMIGCGQRIVSERMSGSDCWWFEYGGICDTVKDQQAIALELRRLVMGVWNYIKNSGKFNADYYTLEWVGSIPGKRESRRMRTEYCPTETDILSGKTYPDGAFYGGWYIDLHPSGGMYDTKSDNCTQTPIQVYQLPLRCLYSRETANLLFAGRNIGVSRNVFASSRIMNTCALSGQAAGTLAAECIARSCAPSELNEEAIVQIRQTLLREDMFIPSLRDTDGENLAYSAKITASSELDAAPGRENGRLSLAKPCYAVFPALAGQTAEIRVFSAKSRELKASISFSKLPNRMCRVKQAQAVCRKLKPGNNSLSIEIPAEAAESFCLVQFEENPDASLYLCEARRCGFICGQIEDGAIYEPYISYSGGLEKQLYRAENIADGYLRPWGAPRQWCAAADDKTPWLELSWEEAQHIAEIRLYLDPELCMELPSSRTKSWQECHRFTARTEMPGQLIRDFHIQARDEAGSLHEICNITDNCRRLVIIETDIVTSKLRLCIDRSWGSRSAAVYAVRVREKR